MAQTPTQPTPPEGRVGKNVPNEASMNLISAARIGDIATVKGLVATGLVNVNVTNEDGWSPLWVSCLNGHLDVVKILIEAGANVNLANNDGMSPLLASIFEGHLDIVKILIEAGANVNLATKDGRSPLVISSSNGHLDVVKMLIEAGANVNLATMDGWSPLWTSCFNGHLDVVKILIEAGANVNLVDKNNATPLYVASENGDHTVVQMLLRAGANVNIARSDDGTTALDIAVKNGHNEIIEVLKTSQSKVDSHEHRTVISSPIGLTVDGVYSTSVSISWQPPLDAKCIIREYQVSYTMHGGSEHFHEVQDTTSAELTSLEPCTEYTIRVRAKMLDFGDYSTPITIYTLETDKTLADITKISSEGGIYENTEYGLKIMVPCGAVGEGEMLEMKISPQFQGLFLVSDKYLLITPYYLIIPSLPLRKPIHIFMEHCLEMQKSREVVVLRADHDIKSGTGLHNFEPILNPDMSDTSPVLSFQIQNLCFLCASVRTHKRHEIFYTLLLYEPEDNNVMQTAFSILIYACQFCNVIIKECTRQAKKRLGYKVKVTSINGLKFDSDTLQFEFKPSSEHVRPKTHAVINENDIQLHRKPAGFKAADVKGLTEQLCYPPSVEFNISNEAPEDIKIIIYGSDKEECFFRVFPRKNCNQGLNQGSAICAFNHECKQKKCYYTGAPSDLTEEHKEWFIQEQEMVSYEHKKDYEVVDEIILRDDNHSEIFKLTKKACSKWRGIGRILGFTEEQLSSIVREPGRTGEVDYYSAMLMRWLDWAPPNHNLPSVQQLSSALNDMGCERMAYDLNQKYRRP